MKLSSFSSLQRFNPTMFVLAFALVASACSSADPDDQVPPINPVDDATLSVIATYSVEGNTILGDPPSEHRVVWERFAQLFPAPLHPEINLFVAIDQEASGGTDGAMQISAANPLDFYLALDVTMAGTMSVLDRTMIHEFAHLITLRPSQVPRDEDAIDTCAVFTDDLGCPGPDSYLTAYFTEFWPGYTGADLEAEGDDPTDAEARFATGEFVTEYAATIPTEDIAEVFAEWVLLADAPTGDTVLDDKLRFWDDYPEVVAIKTSVRAEL